MTFFCTASCANNIGWKGNCTASESNAVRKICADRGYQLTAGQDVLYESRHTFLFFSFWPFSSSLLPFLSSLLQRQYRFLTIQNKFNIQSSTIWTAVSIWRSNPSIVDTRWSRSGIFSSNRSVFRGSESVCVACTLVSAGVHHHSYCSLTVWLAMLATVYSHRSLWRCIVHRFSHGETCLYKIMECGPSVAIFHVCSDSCHSVIAFILLAWTNRYRWPRNIDCPAAFNFWVLAIGNSTWPALQQSEPVCIFISLQSD